MLSRDAKLRAADCSRPLNYIFISLAKRGEAGAGRRRKGGGCKAKQGKRERNNFFNHINPRRASYDPKIAAKFCKFMRNYVILFAQKVRIRSRAFAALLRINFTRKLSYFVSRYCGLPRTSAYLNKQIEESRVKGSAARPRKKKAPSAGVSGRRATRTSENESPMAMRAAAANNCKLINKTLPLRCAAEMPRVSRIYTNHLLFTARHDLWLIQIFTTP